MFIDFMKRLPPEAQTRAGEIQDSLQALFAKCREANGVYYPTGAMRMRPHQWQQQMGSRWPEWLLRKQQFDPDGLLSRGQGFS